VNKSVLLLRVLVAALVVTSWSAGRPAAAEVDAKTAFAKLKTLAGNWNGVGDNRVASAVSYRLGADGNTVIETQCGGTAQEMLTVYNVVGSDLVATHYCNLGNQPHFKLDLKSSTADKLVFDFDGGVGFDPGKDGHIHGGTINFASGKVDTLWDYYEGGQKKAGTRFQLSRLAKGAAMTMRCGKPLAQAAHAAKKK
jgi:hypothetical protein